MLDLRFQYTRSSVSESFEAAFADAFSQINLDGKIIKMSVSAASYSLTDYFDKLNFINTEVQNRLPNIAIDVSFIAQKPLDSELIIELVMAANECNVSYTLHCGISYATIACENEKTLILSGVIGKRDQTISLQSADVFQKISEILKHENMPVSSIVRQWNFIPDITRFENGFQHYQQFNDARTLFYETTKWDNGYPAATGIGTINAPLLIDLIAMKGQIEEHPIVNSKQIDAHVYSDEVLLGAKDSILLQRSTPKFERAKLIIEKTNTSVFISGTAAIIGEESLALNNAAEQTNITIDNIINLVSKEALHFCEIKFEPLFESVRVYIKHSSNYQAVKQICEKRFPNRDIAYVEGDICRDELLVEIEAFVKIR